MADYAALFHHRQTKLVSFFLGPLPGVMSHVTVGAGPGWEVAIAGPCPIPLPTGIAVILRIREDA